MRHARRRQTRHLLLRGAHEQEPGSVQQERREVLEAVDLRVHIPTLRSDECIAIPQHEADFNDAEDASADEGVSEDGMHHRAEHEFLRMGGHGPAGHGDDDARDDVSTRSAVAVFA